MKVQYISDLHLEFGPKYRVRVHPDTDIFVLAGDIHTKPRSLNKFFRQLKLQKDIPIIYVLGNHEYYTHHIDTAILDYREACKEKYEDVYLLDNEALVLDGVKFVGSTLYTDLSDPLEAMKVKEALSDFRIVGGMTVEKWRERYRIAKDYLKAELSAKKKNQKCVVITHFVPIRTNELIREAFKGSLTNAGFYTNEEEMIFNHEPDYWIFGHSHYNKNIEIGKTKLVCNQLGYYYEGTTVVDHATFDV